jgi:hypothetical protein
MLLFMRPLLNLLISLALFSTIFTINTFAQPFNCDGVPLILSGSLTNSSLFVVNTATNPFTLTQIAAPGIGLNALGFNLQNGLVYAVQPTTNNVYTINSLGVITLASPTINLGPSASQYSGGDFDTNGNYYIKLGGGSNNVMRKINVNTGVITPITLSQNVDSIDIAYNIANGLIYMRDNITNQLFSIDPTTGTATNLGLIIGSGIAGGATTGSVWFDGEGYLYLYLNPGNIYRMDVNTRNYTLFSSSSAITSSDGANCNTKPTFNKSFSDNSIEMGVPTTLTMTVFNPDPFNNLNGTLNDTLSGGLQFVPESLTQSGFITNGTPNGYGGSANLVVSNFTIAPRATGTFTVGVVSNYSSMPGSYTGAAGNQATITGLSSAFGSLLSNDNATLEFNDSTAFSVVAASDYLGVPVAQNDTRNSPSSSIVYSPLADDINIPSSFRVGEINGTPVTNGSSVTVPNGRIVVNSDGTLTVFANPGFSGDVSFTYAAVSPFGDRYSATSSATFSQPPLQSVQTVQPIPTLIRTGGIGLEYLSR